MAARLSLLIMLLMLSACAVRLTDPPHKIALLAPFEGRYRDIGYDALYAARLGVAEAGVQGVELLAVDDGGSIQTAAGRMRALRQDSTVRVVIVMGPQAIAGALAHAAADLPALVVGSWGAPSLQDGVYILSSPAISTADSEDLITLTERDAPFTASDMAALEAFSELRDDRDGIIIMSSGQPASDDFRQRYLSSGDFVPEPGLLATLTYDAVQLAIRSITENISLDAIEHTGLNGTIHFVDHYWDGAPLNRYHYQGGRLVSRAE